MNSATFLALATACAPHVHPDTARAIVATESAFNPNAIGVVGGVLVRTADTRAEAVATARSLEAAGLSYSAGLSQINVANFRRLGLNARTAFEPCASLAAMQVVLRECYRRAAMRSDGAQAALRRALSCYYSGNFTVGVRDGYVGRVVAASIQTSALRRHPVRRQPGN